MTEPIRRWPDGIKAAAAISFDWDAETMWLARDPDNAQRPVTLSQGMYGSKVGMPKLLALLDKYGIRATFFIPGWVIEQNRSLTLEVQAAGHEIGHHGYLHEWPDKHPEQEEAILLKGIAIIEEVTGQRPRGYRSPAAEYTPNTHALLIKHGFEYASTMMDDVVPYKVSVDGKKTDLVELPCAWSLDDAPYFNFSLRPPISRMTVMPREWCVFMKDALIDIYNWGGCYTPFLHPQIIGRPGRIGMLEELFSVMKGLPGLWVGSCEEIASYWRANCD